MVITYTFICIVILLVTFAAIANASMDVLQFKYDKTIFKKLKNQNWWNPKFSHLNKYKNNDPSQGPKFWGSTTYFVFFTDAWHFSQFIFLTSYQLAILFSMNIAINFLWWHWIVGYLFFKFIFGAIFKFFYSYVFIKNAKFKNLFKLN